MTTIVYRDGLVAADSRTNNGGWIDPGSRSKLERVDGAVFAYCGDWAICTAIRAWLKEPNGDQPNGDATVIVFRDGKIFVYSDGSYFEENDGFHAWGSGTPVALGALYAGCTAYEAVEIACQVDLYSGGPVVQLEVRCDA